MSFTFLSSNLASRIAILFFKLSILFLMFSNLLTLLSFGFSIAVEGNSHDSRWNLKSDVNLETRFEHDREECMAKDEEGLLLSGGKTFWVGGAFEGLLLGLRTEWDSSFEAKEDAIKVEATISSWVFFFLWWTIECWGDDGVTIVGKGAYLNLDIASSLSETFLGVVKLGGSTFLIVVSGWKTEVAKVDCSIDGEDVSFYWKGVSPFDARDGERILGSSSFNLFKASRRIEEGWKKNACCKVRSSSVS